MLTNIPEWAACKDLLTVDDIILAGSCPEGATEFRDKHFPSSTAVSVTDILAECGENERRHVLRAAHGDGYGYGYGDGHGDGYGYGDGDGHGDGDGYGYSYGYSDGDGYGYGDGDGYSDDYGYSDG